MADMETLTKQIAALEADQKVLREEIRKGMKDWQEKSQRHMGAAAAGQDASYEAGQTNAAEKAVVALRRQDAEKNVEIERLKAQYRALAEEKKQKEMDEVREELESVGHKVRGDLCDTENSLRRLRALCQKYQILSGSDPAVMKELRPWVELVPAVERLSKGLPAGKIVANRFKVQPEAPWLTRRQVEMGMIQQGA